MEEINGALPGLGFVILHRPRVLPNARLQLPLPVRPGAPQTGLPEVPQRLLPLVQRRDGTKKTRKAILLTSSDPSSVAQGRAVRGAHRPWSGRRVFLLRAGTSLKACPSCVAWVQKISGCNAVVCRCGVAFCYACGKRGDGHSCRCTWGGRWFGWFG